jgi:hypothetical protein
MRKLLRLGVVAMLALGVAAPAGAALLNWEGTLLLELGDLPSLGNTGAGIATVNGSVGGVPAHLDSLRLAASRGGISGTAMVAITDPNAAANGIASIRVQATLQSGTLGPISGAVNSTTTLTQKTLPVVGLAKVCIFSTACGLFLPLELTQNNGAKGVGIGGLLTIGKGSLINISIEAAPWTIKTKTSVDQITTPMTPGGVKKFVNRTQMGFAHDPSSGTTSTAQPSGVVQLISPMQVRTNLATGSNEKLGLFGILTVHFIPEPGMLLLLASGVAGLVVLGRSRLRK